MTGKLQAQTRERKADVLRECILIGGLACSGIAARAQLAGPPAGVPVPTAPIASEQTKPGGAVAAAAGDMHFRVRLLDGRSGLPIKSGRVRLWYDERDTGGYLLTTDVHGEALMPEPVNTPVRILAVPEDMFDCRKLAERESMPGYNLHQTADKGVIAPNQCEAGARALPHAGELTLFARPLRWFEQVNRNTAR